MTPVLHRLLAQALEAVGAPPTLLRSAAFELASLEHADLTSPVAFGLAKELQGQPKAIAERIVTELKKRMDDSIGVGRIEVVGAGYINITLKDQQLWTMTTSIDRPVNATADAPTVIVEYSSPNVAKPLGIGHIRSTIIGESLARIHEFVGSKVVRLNHPGDWGTQFGKLIVMIQDQWGGTVSDDRTIRDFVQIYVQFHERAKDNPELEIRARQETVKLQSRDAATINIWKAICKKSYQEFDRLYARLGIHFDEIRGESAYEADVPSIVARALESGVAQKSEGAVIIPMPGLAAPMLIQKSDGAYLYATTDLAALQYRINKYHPDTILYVVGSQQTLHFQQLRAAAIALGIANDAKTQHIPFGMLLGANHKKLSTREGSSIELESVLDEAVEHARAIIAARPDGKEWNADDLNATAQMIGLGAVTYNDLSQNRIHDVVLDWGRMLSLTGNSAPYLQYCVVRIKSILAQAPEIGSEIGNPPPLVDQEREILRRLVRFPTIVRLSAATNEPHRIADYLFDLACAFHRFYEHVPVLAATPKERNLRCQLIDRAAKVITAGLHLLGINVPERM
ncbi:arginine--tRNA ligase [Candidatus Uhrbacteria bacterium]|nr:arginine--tRNA ligase [Candidatus Uhrbacteria bacterium]